MAIIRKHKELGKQFMEAHPDLPELPSNSPKQYEPKLLEDKIVNGSNYRFVSEIGGGGTADTYEALSPNKEWVVLKQVRVWPQDTKRDIEAHKKYLQREGLILEKLLNTWGRNVKDFIRESKEGIKNNRTVPLVYPNQSTNSHLDFGEILKREIICPYVRVIEKDEQTLVLSYAEGERLGFFELAYKLSPAQRVYALAKYAHAIAIGHKAGFGLADSDPNKGGRYNIDAGTDLVTLQLFDLGGTLTNTSDIPNPDNSPAEPFVSTFLSTEIISQQRRDIRILTPYIYHAFTFGEQQVSDMPLELQDLVYRIAIDKEPVSANECCQILCDYSGKIGGYDWRNKQVTERTSLKSLPIKKMGIGDFQDLLRK